MWNSIKKHKGFLIKLFVACVCIFATIIFANHYLEQQKLANYPYEIIKHEAELTYSEFKCELVKEVKHYIDSIAPSSSLNAIAVVEKCEQYDLDIKFVLAQGHIESNFGTTGMAKKTNSVWNVGAYDNMTVEMINGKHKYKHPDYSIEPYMQLLYKDYITNTKTELDLMAKFVTKGGSRYASNPNYEHLLLAQYKYIDKHTKIAYLQNEMRRYKIISGS